MEKQVATRERASVPQTELAKEPEVLRSDLIVPYLLMGQGLSDAVTDRKVNLGDIYRSTTAEKLGDPDHPVDVIVLTPPRADWVYEQKTGSRFEFRHVEPRNAANETLPWSFWADHDGNEVEQGTKGATEWRRVKRLTVLALLPGDIEAQKKEMEKVEAGELPDPDKALTPVILSFRSSSYRAGKEIITFFSKAKSMRVPVHRYIIRLHDFVDKNDEGTFYVWKVDTNKSKAVPKEALPFVEEWVAIVNSGVNLQTDDQADTANNGGGPRAAEEVG